MLRVTTFLRPKRLRFCSTTIVRDMVTGEQKSPDGMNQMRRGLGNTEFSRKIVSYFCISKAPSNNGAIRIVAAMTALWLDAVAGVKFVHCV